MSAFKIAFEIVSGGATVGETATAKPKADRYRVVRKKYYLGNGPVAKSGASQCVRCNEILGARITRLYTDGATFAVEPSATHNMVADMGVFCAVTALERGERIPSESTLSFTYAADAADLAEEEGV